MEIETRQFEFAHGKKHRGIGHWAFRFTLLEFVGSSLPSDIVEFAPGTVSYSEATKWARARAKELHASRVEVGS